MENDTVEFCAGSIPPRRDGCLSIVLARATRHNNLYNQFLTRVLILLCPVLDK